MAERREAVVDQAVRDGSATYSVEAEIRTSEDVSPGYQRTEVGVIPEDWEVLALRDLSLMKSGEAITSAKIDDSSPYPCYGGNGLRGFTGQYTHDGEHVLIGRQGALCGNVIRASGQFYASEHAVVSTTKNGVDTDWFSYILDSMQLNRLSESSAQPGLSVQKVLGLQTAAPTSQNEQRAISTALSDADALIESLDRLIAKKRAIKQAAMQQLLTGQTRLPGFTGEWETKRLGDVGTFYKGQGIRRDDVSDEGVPCIRYGEIYTRYGDCVVTPVSRIPETIAETAFPLRCGDILFAGSGETAEEIGICVAYLGEQLAFAGGDIVVLRPNEGVSAYLGRLLNHPTIAQQKARLGQGDAVVHISARNLAQIEVQLPRQEEQTAIATILSDMDTEIETLEGRRDKARQIKQGMMQQLLTGRVRLVTPQHKESAAC